MRTIGATLGAALLGACASPAEIAEDSGSGSGSGLHMLPPVHHVDVLAREPMLVEHPTGALFVAGYPSQVTGLDPRSVPRLWRSDDRGDSWESVDVGDAGDGAMGNSDVDLAVGPDGTLYFAAMGFDRGPGEGTHVAVGVSRDIGATWRWNMVSETRFDDRPWVRVVPDGTAHVVWNDGAGVRHASSRDDGCSWAEHARIATQGGSSHFAVGPAGELAVRIGAISASGREFHEEADLIALSVDGGETWQKTPAPGTRAWDPTFSDPEAVPRWVEPLAWDPAGNLYSLWSEGSELHLARSTDRAANWTVWPLGSEDGTAFYPYLVADDTGQLAAAWFARRGESLVANLAILRPADGTRAPQVIRAPPFRPDSWLEGESTRIPSPAGEYMAISFLSDGDIAAVTPIQDSVGGRYGFSWWRGTVR